MTHCSITRLLERCFWFVVLFAACTASSHAQVAPHSGDAGFNAGWNNAGRLQSNGTISTSAFSYGGSGGYNLSENIAVLGEFQYIPEGSYDKVSANTQLYGGLMRYTFGMGKVAPYILVGGGGSRGSLGTSGLSVSVGGGYVGFGGGASIFLGKNWGIRPEFRFNDVFFSAAGTTANARMYQATGGVFFQFGGKGKSTSTHN